MIPKDNCTKGVAMAHHYVYGSDSYWDFLQKKSYINDIRSEISSSSKAIIATNKELAERNVSVLQSASAQMAKGFEQISLKMGGVEDQLREINHLFHWGFSEMLVEMGHIKDSLKELLRVVSSPDQTWAYEQFNIARDAFRKELYDDALVYVKKAILGDERKPGYPLEFRFHFFHGILRLGSFKNTDKKVINLSEAEEAFLIAAKYAKFDYKAEAARALLSAGWAAYCQGKLSEAKKYTTLAIECNPELTEAYFQKAKIKMSQDKPQEAIPYLKTAIIKNPNYAIYAASDNDFLKYESYVNKLLTELKNAEEKFVSSALNQLSNQFEKLKNFTWNGYSFQKYGKPESFLTTYQSAKTASSNNTYFGFLEARALCNTAKKELQSVWGRFFSDLEGVVRNHNNKNINTYFDEENWGMGILIVTFLICLCIGVYSCGSRISYDGNPFASIGSFLGWTLGGLVGAIVLAKVSVGLFKFFYESSQKSRLNSHNTKLTNLLASLKSAQNETKLNISF